MPVHKKNIKASIKQEPPVVMATRRTHQPWLSQSQLDRSWPPAGAPVQG